MKISGFSFMRNTDKLYYPLAESIQSILPIVDEFIIALGKGDPDDNTEKIINSIQSNKIKIIHTEWDPNNSIGGTEYARQTDIAKEKCTGDWLFYLQSDEVVHEKYLPIIKKYCEFYLDDKRVEGFAFQYKHFFGDYDHYIESHSWYAQEIRIIRNDKNIHSWKDAQSFRYIPNFDYKNYYQRKDTRRLSAIVLPSEIYHYGWVRPPGLMQTKTRVMNKSYHDPQKVDSDFDKKSTEFDFGSMELLDNFQDTHPFVMKEFISKFNWKEKLHYEKSYTPTRELMKHEKLKYRFFSWIEKKILHRRVFAYKNFNQLKNTLI
ncbi:MAG: hypothetical protein HOP11_10975 [Saprospiraceae bacterium]|nr:hypothetical protein [Saprospiraceae bacterium]